jgi:2,3-bisphosphoglycerate-dependent phosphoglycerate mutase
MTVTTLILARHGETDWNRDGRWQGHADEPLNDRGRAQAQALAEELADEQIAAVYASDLRRARETAEIVAARLGLDAPIEIDARLREVHVGGWSGLTMTEIETRFPDEVTRWQAGDPTHAFDGGESYALMGQRVVAAVEEIAARHPGEQVLVVLHGGPIRGLLAHAAGISYEEQRHRRRHLDNCGVVRLAVREGKFAGID